MMYWTDWGRKSKIEAAWMDGQHRHVLLDEDLGWPTGLTVDYVNGHRIYWCDSKENVIESMEADGTARNIIMSGGERSQMYFIMFSTGLVFSTLTSQQVVAGFEFACSPLAHVGFLQVLPPTVPRHSVRLIHSS